MDCPKCLGKLQKLNLRLFKGKGEKDGLNLDKCFVCTGIWFDKGEIKKLKQLGIDRSSLDSHLNDPELYKRFDEKGGLCPCCNVPMRKIKGKYGTKTITIDVCKKCKGVWLDGGEVNYITRSTEDTLIVGSILRFWRNARVTTWEK